LSQKSVPLYLYGRRTVTPVGPYGIGDSFIEQGGAFGSVPQKPFIELFTASTEEAIYYLCPLYFSPAAFKIECTDVLPTPT
jgi:hypothetical protein